MSNKGFTEELEDKYANKSVTFGSGVNSKKQDLVQPKVFDLGGLQNLGSEVRKVQEAEEAKPKPDSLITKKMKRIFGGVNDMRG